MLYIYCIVHHNTLVTGLEYHLLSKSSEAICPNHLKQYVPIIWSTISQSSEGIHPNYLKKYIQSSEWHYPSHLKHYLLIIWRILSHSSEAYPPITWSNTSQSSERYYPIHLKHYLPIIKENYPTMRQGWWLTIFGLDWYRFTQALLGQSSSLLPYTDTIIMKWMIWALEYLHFCPVKTLLPPKTHTAQNTSCYNPEYINDIQGFQIV